MGRWIDAFAYHGGRSVAYVGVGMLEVALGYRLAVHHADALTGFAAVLSAVNVGLFGGGALKAWADRNGGNHA
jgi:sulfite exporter TauE/SafE